MRSKTVEERLILVLQAREVALQPAVPSVLVEPRIFEGMSRTQDQRCEGRSYSGC